VKHRTISHLHQDLFHYAALPRIEPERAEASWQGSARSSVSRGSSVRSSASSEGEDGSGHPMHPAHGRTGGRPEPSPHMGPKISRNVAC
jgi:hypothetical protein